MSSLLSSAYQSAASRDASLVRWLVRASVALPFLWGCAQIFPPLNHDVGAVLQWAGRMLDGDRLYVDIFDVNPPLIYWLNLVPAGLAKLFSASAPVMYVLCVLAAVLGSLTLARPVFATLVPADSFAALALPGIALFVLVAYPQGSFGQREHLLVIFTLPYLLLAAARARGIAVDPRRAAIIGLVAAVGIGIKPFFAALPVLIEAYLLVRCGWARRWRDPAPWMIGLFGVAYIVAARLIHPAYFTHEMALAAQYYEPGIGWSVLSQAESLGIILPLIPFGCAAFLLRGMALAPILAVASIAWLISACLQGRGWDYHYLPARSGVIMLGAVIAASLLDRSQNAIPAKAKAAIGTGGLIMTLFLGGDLSPPFKNELAFADSPAGHVLPIIRNAAQGKPVLWLTTSIYPQFPVLNYTDSVLAMPNESLWLLPALYADAPAPDGKIQFHAMDALPAAESELMHGTIAMTKRLKPALIITTDSWAEPGYRGRDFDYLAYFGRDPDFAALFADYRPLTKLGAWTFYERIPGR